MLLVSGGKQSRRNRIDEGTFELLKSSRVAKRRSQILQIMQVRIYPINDADLQFQDRLLYFMRHLRI